MLLPAKDIDFLGTATPNDLEEIRRMVAEIARIKVPDVCLHARHHQEGIVFNLVKNVEQGICPFCQAYERVHGRKADERRI